MKRNTLIAVVVAVIVSALLTLAVSSTSPNPDGVRTFGTIVVFLAFAWAIFGSFFLGKMLRKGTPEGRATEEIAKRVGGSECEVPLTRITTKTRSETSVLHTGSGSVTAGEGTVNVNVEKKD